MSDKPTDFNRPERKLLDTADIDSLGLALLTLTRELWVLNDRVRVLEAVLESQGIEVREAVERFQPDQDLRAELDEEGRALVERIADVLAGN